MRVPWEARMTLRQPYPGNTGISRCGFYYSQLWRIDGGARGHYSEGYLSHEKNLGWLGYIGDYTTQLHKDYNTSLLSNQYNGK